MKIVLILFAAIVATLAQDTHFCPDGWELHVRSFVIILIIGYFNQKKLVKI